MILIRQISAVSLAGACFEATRHGGHVSIENFPWAATLCKDAWEATDAVIDGVGEVGFGFSKGLASIFLKLVNSGSFLGSDVSDRARMLLLMGDTHAVQELLTETIAMGHEDPALPLMLRQLKAFLATLQEAA